MPPHLRRDRRTLQSRPRCPVTGASRRGMGCAAGRDDRSSPHSGVSSRPAARPPSQLPAALCARGARCYSSPSARWPQVYLRCPAQRARLAPPAAHHGAGRNRFLRYDLCVRQGDGTWPSLVKALVWGTREPGFKSRRPDEAAGRARRPKVGFAGARSVYPGARAPGPPRAGCCAGPGARAPGPPRAGCCADPGARAHGDPHATGAVGGLKQGRADAASCA
jgi:hypothetical protein